MFRKLSNIKFFFKGLDNSLMLTFGLLTVAILSQKKK